MLLFAVVFGDPDVRDLGRTAKHALMGGGLSLYIIAFIIFLCWVSLIGFGDGRCRKSLRSLTRSQRMWCFFAVLISAAMCQQGPAATQFQAGKAEMPAGPKLYGGQSVDSPEYIVRRSLPEHRKDSVLCTATDPGIPTRYESINIDDVT